MLSASGDIAFVGFNADGNDDLAFVTFVDIGAGETIFFSDNEWNGTGWVDTNENAWSWTATSSVIPGTIITISNIGAGAVSSNLGTVVIPIAGMGSNRGLSASGETVYAYLGTASVPTVFLTAIANDGNVSANGSLANTGLTFGLNAIDLSPISAGEDIGTYTGPRIGQPTLSDYRALVNSTANWITQDGSGDQGIDTVAPDVPFSTTAFTAGVALPSLSINNVAVNEGDAGTATLQFTVTLSSASTSTVTVDYATADNTATLAGNDYASASGTLTFAPGETVKAVDVTVNGDTSVEPAETLRVNLSNAVNATISTAQGTGTIQNDDFSLVAIHDIQGAGLTSPLAGQVVTTTGIVTAVDNNGFYLQAPDASTDGNDVTSEAIFVFTSSAPTVAIGNGVRVTGTVTEFTPGGLGTGNLSITELTSPTVTVLTTGNPLPAAVIVGEGGRLAPTESVTEGIAFFESLKAMRVTVPNPLVVSGTNEFGEIWLVSDQGANATNLSPRNTLVSEGSFGDGLTVTNAGPGSDYNPERIQIDADPQLTPGGTPLVNPGGLPVR
jgi:hypothetical protein